jgi:hypothetical protein
MTALPGYANLLVRFSMVPGITPFIPNTGIGPAGPVAQGEGRFSGKKDPLRGLDNPLICG